MDVSRFSSMLSADPFVYAARDVPLRDPENVAVGDTPESFEAMIGAAPAFIVPEIARAWTDDVDDTDVTVMLDKIVAMPLPPRPKALRALACCLQVMPKQIGNVPLLSPEAWARALAQTGQGVVDEIAWTDRAQMLADLDIAGWQMLPVSVPGAVKAYRSACWLRLQTLPHRYWPDVLDAAVAKQRDLTGLDVDAIVQDASIRFPHMSDRLALAFAKSASSVGASLFMTMQQRLGVTEAQYARLLRPREAERLARMCLRQAIPCAMLWRQYETPDAALVDMTEEIVLKEALPGFLKNGTIRARMANFFSIMDADDAALERSLHEERRFAAYFARIESHAVASVCKTSAPADADDTGLYHAFVSVCARMRDRANTRAAFDAILAMPLGYQPVLMEAWAARVDAGHDDAEAAALRGDVSRWAERCWDAFLSRDEPTNAVRTSVAELRAVFSLAAGQVAQCAPTLARVTHRVFGTLPSESWSAMLDYLVPAQPFDRFEEGRSASYPGSAPIVDAQRFREWVGIFLHNPRAGFAAPPKNLSFFRMEAAQRFAGLPDEADATTSKFERLGQRLGAPATVDWVNDAFVDVVAKAIPVDAPHLRSVIRTTLHALGFTDEVSFHRVLFRCRAAQCSAPDRV